MSDIRLSYHAELRKIEMGLTDEEAEAAFYDPHVTYPADSRHGPGRIIHLRDRVCVVIGPDKTVITFMPSGKATSYQSYSRYPATPMPCPSTAHLRSNPRDRVSIRVVIADVVVTL